VADPETMTTFRPEHPEEFFTEWTWQTTLDWAHDAAHTVPVDVIEERWQLVERRTFTVTEPCGEIGCPESATHWGLCEAHAREDDPTAFDDQ